MTAVATAPPTDAAAPTARKRRRRPLTARTLIFSLAAYVVAIIFILPYAEMIITAMRPPAELQDRGYIPRRWDWANFTSIWKTGFGTNLRVSLEIAGGATLLVLLVGIQRQFVSYDLPNRTFSLILVNAGFNLAFAVWILNAYFSSIPSELEEAAMVDGTSRLGALSRITLPLALPGIVTALIFTFIGAWNEFLVALTLTGQPKQYPLTVAINNYVGQYSVDWGHLFEI